MFFHINNQLPIGFITFRLDPPLRIKNGEVISLTTNDRNLMTKSTNVMIQMFPTVQ
jgi:hypothetical protein